MFIEDFLADLLQIVRICLSWEDKRKNEKMKEIDTYVLNKANLYCNNSITKAYKIDDIL